MSSVTVVLAQLSLKGGQVRGRRLLAGESTLHRVARRVPKSVALQVPDPVRRRFGTSTAKRRKHTIEAFHQLFYDTGHRTWRDTRCLGVPVWKTPLDLWIYQEMVFELRPDLIVETGTSFGGSALWFAVLCDLVGNGSVVSIDIARREQSMAPPEHPRITYLLGSSVSDEIVAEVRARAEAVQTTMVVLDSDHSRDHVLAELRRYGPMVSPGGYLVVEDTNVNGHPVMPAFGPGPMEAVEAFLADDPEFEIDVAREKFLFTFNPHGFLRRRPAEVDAPRSSAEVDAPAPP